MQYRYTLPNVKEVYLNAELCYGYWIDSDNF